MGNFGTFLKIEGKNDRFSLGPWPVKHDFQSTKLLSLLTKYPKDAYLSLGCSYHKDDCLNSNEPIEDALELVKRLKPPSLKGIGVNCTKPQYISIFGNLAARILPDLTLIAYPNSGEEYHQEG